MKKDREQFHSGEPSSPATQELLNRLLLTRDEVSQLLAVPESTIGNLHRYGTLPGRRVGKYLRWHPDVVAAYVKRLEEETS